MHIVLVPLGISCSATNNADKQECPSSGSCDVGAGCLRCPTDVPNVPWCVKPYDGNNGTVRV